MNYPIFSKAFAFRSVSLLLMILSGMILAACGESSAVGGGASANSLSGTWTTNSTKFSTPTQYILEITDSDGDLSGSFITKAQGLNSRTLSFDGRRSGSSVTISFNPSYPIRGTFSGDSLTMYDLLYNEDVLTFARQ